ncbi:MAG: peptidyl-prolyl cis-trans isomerase [Planctomycetes bacterium]|nr:peptidyl-prolyl cis-trans isomerase [Planctomycetota bacterium]
MLRFTATAALFAAALGLTAAAQDPQDQIKMLRRQVDVLSDQLTDERARLLLDIKVNGKVLDPKEVKREAVYLTGGKLVEAKVADFFILEELKRQIDSGKRRAEEFVINEEDVLRELAPMKTDFETKNPGVDFWEVVRSQYGLSKETFLEQRRQSILFDKLFFPGSPKDWPDITKEAIKAQTQSDQGPKFIEQLEKATEGVDEQGNPKKLPEFWVNMMRQFVQKGLRSWSDIQYASNGLPADVVLKVNDLQWGTDEAFAFIKKGIYVQDLERAMQEVAVREALRQELEKNDAYVSDEVFQERYEAYRQPYDSTPFTVEVIATRFKGYPCLEAYRARWRLQTSYADLIADQINTENLQAHADKYAAFFADGQVSIDVIPFQARNPKTGAWEPNGMDQAKTRAEAVFASIEKKEKTFDEALNSHLEFFANDEKRGRLGFLPLNQLKQQLRENEFTTLHDGFSISDYLFFEAEVGTIVGPIAGPDGYFIARINSRTPARRKIDVTNEKERELVREDYISHRFFDWANEVIGRAKFE